MPMRLKEYGRNPRKRKEYIQQDALLLIGVDVSKSKHDACIGTLENVKSRIEFRNARDGFQRFEDAIRKNMFRNRCKRVLIAMEPSGLYWYALYNRLRRCGYGVCLVNCQAVKNNRKTMADGASKTDKKDAYSIFDLLQQGKFFLPVERDEELNGAYRMMRRHMGLKKRVSQIRNQLRGAIHLAFPELNDCINDVTQPTSLRFLQSNPTPESVMRNGRKRFLDKWKPRRRCGQWRPEKFKRIYALAKESIGLKDPYRTDEFEIKTLAHDLEDAVVKQQMWLNKAIELLRDRDDFQLLLTIPRVGEPTAAAILTAIGNITEYTNGKQLVKLAGLDVRLYESGSSILRRPRVSRIGSAYLRQWIFFLALRLVAHDPGFRNQFEKLKNRSPGKGSGLRALTSVCDKLLRIIYRMLKDNEKYSSEKDKVISEYYLNQRKAA